MRNIRFNKIIAIVGARGTGKTTFVFGDEKAGIKAPLLDLYINKKQMKVLVVCCEDSPVYRHIPIITKDDFINFKKGIARVIINPEDINQFCRFLNESNNQYNTLLIFDDARNHTEVKICKELNRILANTKQQNIDVFFMYHSFGETPLDLYKKIDYIQLFKTLDHPEARKSRMTSYYKDVIKAYEAVTASSNRFISKTISTIQEIR